MIIPSLITVPGLAAEEVKTLSQQFKAETPIEWCGRHTASTDNFAKGFCSGYKSQADLTEPAPVIDADSLRAAKPLEGDALKFDCALPKRFGPGAARFSADTQKKLMQEACSFLFGNGPDGLLAPPDARNVKLALRAAFRPSFGLPATEIHIAISSATEGTYLLAQRDGNWQTRSGALTPADIDKILAALKNSHFWQLPFAHQWGVLDGEPILVEAAFDGWRHTSTQNAYQGVDLDILAQQLSAVARAHNTERPLSWFK